MEELTQEINDMIEALEKHKIFLNNSQGNAEMEAYNKKRIQNIKDQTIIKVKDLLQLLET